jgi:hypothetical protein
MIYEFHPPNQTNKMSFTSAHNDYLDPDRHLHNQEEDTPIATHIDSPCREEVSKLRNEVEEAIRFIETNPRHFATSWSDLFSHTPTGDFDWSQEEAGDWIPSQDEETWTQNAYAINLSRKDKVEVVEFTSVDCDGNWDCDSRIERRQKERLSKQDRDELEHETAYQHCYYSMLKQQLYNISVAETGEDPLENTIGKQNPREVHSRNLIADVYSLVADVYKLATKTL